MIVRVEMRCGGVIHQRGVTITGKIGALRISNPEVSADAQKIEVQG